MEGRGRSIFLTLCLLASLRTTVSQKLKLSNKGAEEAKNAGDNFLVVCALVESNSNAKLRWYNPNGEQYPYEIKTDSVRIQPSSSRKNSKLILRNLTISDAGVYTCKVTIDGKTLEASTTLTISRPLKFEECKSPQLPILHKDALIRCRATGDPSPTVTWTYKDKLINTGGRYEIRPDGLFIKNITEADNGLYNLEAEIISKSSFDDKNIIVKVVVPPKISNPPAVSPPVEGSDFKLRCEATGDPSPTYSWLKDNKVLTGQRFHIDTITGELKVDKVKKSDSGKYMCVASNSGGNDTATAEVTILVPPSLEIKVEPKSHTEGQKVSMVCRGKGVPPPSLIWLNTDKVAFPFDKERDGILVKRTKTKPDQEVILTISSVKAQNSGNYTCVGSNEAGTKEEAFYLTVKYKPIFVNTPSVAYNWVGNKANITCTAKSLPEAIINWSVNGGKISNTSTYKLFQKPGKELMTGYLQVSVDSSNENRVFTDYTCEAVNTVASQKMKIALKKAVVPQRPSKIDRASVTPTTATLLIHPPANDGGIAVSQYRTIIAGAVEKEREVDFSVDEGTDKTVLKVVIDKLKPDAKYHLKVFAGNKVGLSTTSVDLSLETPMIRRPFEVIISSQRQGESPNSYRVTWVKPHTGGAKITSYSVQYRTVHIVKDSEPWRVDLNKDNGNFMTQHVQGKTTFELSNLKSNTYYQVQVVATNKVGNSNPRPFIFKTKFRSPGSLDESEFPDDYLDEYNSNVSHMLSVTIIDIKLSVPVGPSIISDSSTDDSTSDPKSNVYKASSEVDGSEMPMTAASSGMGSGGIAAVILTLLLIVLIALDLVCYFKFNKGVTMFIVSNTCKKASGAKDKSADVEAGASQETTLLTDKQQKETEPAGEENKDAATEEGVTDEKKPLKNEDTDDDLKKDQPDKIDTDDKKAEEKSLTKDPENV
ncbi:neural cell adhesion molecule 2-like isoform X5 [Argonauta hians]